MTETARALKSLPTLSAGQCCDLKIDDGERRVWICRVGGGVTVEKLIRGYGMVGDRWRVVEGGCSSDGSEEE